MHSQTLCVIRKMNSDKINIIKNQLILLFAIFGGFAILISLLFGNLMKNWANIIYPLGFAIGTTIFGILTLFGIDYLKELRENRFFKREPYNEIERRTIKKIKIHHSKYDYPKTQRIIELDREEYAIEYYDDFFKIPISDVLLVYNLTKKKVEPNIINYKTKKYNRTELLNAIRE